ncbi:MAG TPA: alpha/beta hydrolase [Candidatus Angelobacter sp.]
MSDPARPVLDPRTQWFLNFLIELKRPQVFEVPVEEARAMFVKGQQLFATSQLPAKTEDRTLPVGPRGSVRIRTFKPEGADGSVPVVMYFHGGGWVLGDAATYDHLMRKITNGATAAVVFVEYSRSPEERYPVPVEECYAATKWVVEHCSELGLDASRLAVAGDSAGGNMAAAVCLLAKERGGPRIAAQALVYPATGSGFDTPSFQQFGEGYYLTAEASRWFWHQYAPDRSADQDPHACPLLASLDQLKDLPPALIITAECDILRDEGEAYARKLTEAGVPVTCTRYLGAIHGFMGANALADTPAARAALAQMNAMLKEALAEKAASVTRSS